MNNETIAAFNKFAEQYSDFAFQNILQYELNRFISLIPKKAKVLDLACGPGRDVQYFMDEGFEVIGIDASENIIKEAKKNVPEGNFKVMRMESLEFPKDNFDAVWALDAISYIERNELKKLLATLNKILKQEGIIFISAREGEGEKIIEYEKLGKSQIKINFFRQQELEKLLTENSFEILNSYTQEGEDFTWINIYAKKK